MFGFRAVLETEVIPPNELPEQDPSGAFCILGAGKTGQDAMLFLLGRGVDPVRLAWVMPTDPWITARDPPPPLRQNTCAPAEGGTGVSWRWSQDVGTTSSCKLYTFSLDSPNSKTREVSQDL